LWGQGGKGNLRIVVNGENFTAVYVTKEKGGGKERDEKQEFPTAVGKKKAVNVSYHSKEKERSNPPMGELPPTAGGKRNCLRVPHQEKGELEKKTLFRNSQNRPLCRGGQGDCDGMKEGGIRGGGKGSDGNAQKYNTSFRLML